MKLVHMPEYHAVSISLSEIASKFMSFKQEDIYGVVVVHNELVGYVPRGLLTDFFLSIN